MAPLGVAVGLGLALWNPSASTSSKTPEQAKPNPAHKLKKNEFTKRLPSTRETVPPGQIQRSTGQEVIPTNNSPQWQIYSRSQNNLQPGGTTARRVEFPGSPNRSPLNPNPQPKVMPVRSDFDLQLALDRLGFSPGNIDGLSGPQTRTALRAFQSSVGLSATGQLDANTKQRLTTRGPAWTTYVVQTNDVRALRPMGRTWTEKAQQDFLAYESLLELIAERHHCSERLLQRENPRVNWTQLQPGSTVRVPGIATPPIQGRAAMVRIRLADRTLQALDETGKLMLHFPCSIAASVDKRPMGELKVDSIAPNPNYTFDPAMFPNSPEARAGGGRLIVNSGPNNPVGSVWLGLNRPGYGIHGTPDPSKIGRTESLGCFRLANWNAKRLLAMVSVGTRVLVEP
jgi:lipoprotein-anchoring transpeptidase ErfK/SrfK